jgi:hypothetical protein
MCEIADFATREDVFCPTNPPSHYSHIAPRHKNSIPFRLTRQATPR